jgi:hypothetical protein
MRRWPMVIILGAPGHIGSNLVHMPDTAGTKWLPSYTTLRGWRPSGRKMSNLWCWTGWMASACIHFSVGAGGRNPPVATSVDTDAAELRTAKGISEAANGSGLEKIVVASTYCARVGEAIGDLGCFIPSSSRWPRPAFPRRSIALPTTTPISMGCSNPLAQACHRPFYPPRCHPVLLGRMHGEQLSEQAEIPGGDR